MVAAANPKPDVVVDTDWIAARLGDPAVRLIEMDVNSKAYEQGHLPGSVLWNAYTDLRDATYRPVGRADLGGSCRGRASHPKAPSLSTATAHRSDSGC